jgi:hypothetical protein
MDNFTTPSGASWRTDVPVKSSVFSGEGYLTGKYETHNNIGDCQVMVEVSHDFGSDFVFEDFILQ